MKPRHLTLFALIASTAVLLQPMLADGEHGRNEWPFHITPDGKPNLSIQILKFADAGRFTGIEARHELVFDGLRYVSRISFPEIESTLLPGAHGEFVWRAPSGSVMELRTRDANNPRGPKAWSLQASKSGALTVARRDGEEAFEYRDGRLAVARWGTEEFHFEADATGRFCRLFGSAGQPLVAAFYNGAAMIELVSGTKRITFNYENGRVITCDDLQSQKNIFKCRYSDQMLAEISDGRDTVEFHWGLPVFEEYYKLENPLFPVVVDDGINAYRVSINKVETKVAFSARGSPRNGEWRVGTNAAGIATISMRIRTKTTP